MNPRRTDGDAAGPLGLVCLAPLVSGQSTSQTARRRDWPIGHPGQDGPSGSAARADGPDGVRDKGRISPDHAGASMARGIHSGWGYHRAGLSLRDDTMGD